MRICSNCGGSEIIDVKDTQGVTRHVCMACSLSVDTQPSVAGHTSVTLSTLLPDPTPLPNEVPGSHYARLRTVPPVVQSGYRTAVFATRPSVRRLEESILSVEASESPTPLKRQQQRAELEQTKNDIIESLRLLREDRSE